MVESKPHTDESHRAPAPPLAEHQDLHRLLVDRVRDYAIYALDPTGHVLTWNAGAERLKGYRLEEIIGKHFSVFFPKDDVEKGKPERELEVAKDEGQTEDEGWRIRKDGSRFWANVLITALRDDDGRLVGFAKVTRDLTERRLADEEVRESEERFRLLVTSVKDYAIFMLDPNGCVKTWNAGAQRIKGYTAEEIVGKHFSIFYPLEDRTSGKLEYELKTARETGKYEEEGWRVRKDGTPFWASVIITAVRNAKGELTGFAKVTRDLTERRAADQQRLADARRLAAEEAARSAAEQRAHDLRALADQLHVQAEELEERSHEAEAANRAKSEFLAAMSHELRTPLNAIGGYAQLMQMGVSGPLTPDQAEHLSRIQRSQEHLLGIINDILNFSRVEAGQVSYDIGPVPVRDLIDDVVPMIEPQARANDLTLVIGKCEPDIVARADRSKVEQILLNLLSNAVKFTPAGGRIEIRCEADERMIRLAVADTGIGIPADHMESVFAPFVQVGRGLSSPKEGTGLGLAISRDLAQAMAGDLVAKSAEGKGSTFTVILPRNR